MLDRPRQLPIRVAALACGLAALASACERPPAAPVSAPAPIPTVVAQEAARSGIELTHPSQAAAAWTEELGYLEQLVGLWWAARDEHRRIDGTDVHAVFERAREKTGACTKLACYAGVLRETLCALGDGHLTVQPEWWLPRKRFESGIRLVATKDRVVVAAPPPEGLSAGDVLVTVAGASTTRRCERSANGQARRRRSDAATPSRACRRPVDSTMPSHRRASSGFTGAAGERRRGRSAGTRQPPPTAGRRPRASRGASSIVPVRSRTSAWRRSGATATRVGSTRSSAPRRRPRPAPSGWSSICATTAAASMGRRSSSPPPSRATRSSGCAWPPPAPVPGRDPPAPTFFRSYVEPSDKLAQWKKADLWFLIGPGCFSTCDTFVAALRALERAHFVGETTAGGVGNPTPFRLPYSGIVVNIPVTLYAAPGRADDVLIEAHGTEPGTIVTASADDVRLARDPVLDAALAK